MEVDRVAQMGGVGREATPTWPRSAKRKRRFVEEIEPAASDPEEENLPEDAGNPSEVKTEENIPSESDGESEEGGLIDLMA